MLEPALRWEMRRMSEFGTAIVCFALVVAWALRQETQGAYSVDYFLPAFLFAAALGACVAADANLFGGRADGVADLAFLVTRPLGRLPLFRLRLGVVGGVAVVLWGGSGALALLTASPANHGWAGDWLISLTAYVFLALAMLGLTTEPKVGLRERLRRDSLALKLAPLFLLSAVLWVPILTRTVDVSRAGPAEYWMGRFPVLFPLGLIVLTVSYILGLARDWNRADIVS